MVAAAGELRFTHSAAPPPNHSGGRKQRDHLRLGGFSYAESQQGCQGAAGWWTWRQLLGPETSETKREASVLKWSALVMQRVWSDLNGPPSRPAQTTMQWKIQRHLANEWFMIWPVIFFFFLFPFAKGGVGSNGEPTGLFRFVLKMENADMKVQPNWGARLHFLAVWCFSWLI